MRACLYARFSTDRQSDASIEDQFRLCESRLPAGAKVVARHSDAAVSGSTPIAQRPGGRALMADIVAGRVDLVVVESLDRISRDQLDQLATLRAIERAGARLVTTDGYDSAAAGKKIVSTLRGLMSEMYLDDLRAKTHRGLTGRALAGHVVTGPSYGYRIEKGESGSRYVVDEAQAEVVRGIFDRYARGAGLQSIVFDLNARGVVSPRGGTWAVSALYGAPNKGSGVLNNELYRGKMIWNRSKWTTDEQGKRRREDRPREEWIESDDPSLRIVADDVWQAVRARIGNRRPKGGRPARTVFGGLLRCPSCHGPMVAVDAVYYGCAARKDRGPSVCPGFTLRRKSVDESLLAVLRVMLERDDFGAQFQRELRDQLADDDAGRAQVATRLRTLDKQIDRIVDAIADSGHSAPLLARLKAAETEREALREQQRATPDAVDVAAIWKQVKVRLREMLAAGNPTEMRAGVAELLGPVLLKVDPATGETWGDVVVRGLAAGGESVPTKRKRRPGDPESALQITVVAGAGFEPATFGL